MIFNWCIAAVWAVFIVYWGVSSLSTKRTMRRDYTWVWSRIAAIIAVLLLVNLSGVRFNVAYHPMPVVGWLGVSLCVLGVAFAIWARYHLGKNWGMPMSVKENPELVMSGPYSFVRHP